MSRSRAVRAEITDLGGADNGRPGIGPEVAVRLMLAGFLLGVVHDRRVMRDAQVNIAIRGFVGYAWHEALPDHSSLTCIRLRRGEHGFRRIFSREVRPCQAAGPVVSETVHIDAGLIRADVSMDAPDARQVDAVIPPATVVRRKRAQGFPSGRFKYDPHPDIVRCPAKRRLTPPNAAKSGHWHRANRRDGACRPLTGYWLADGTAPRRVHMLTNHAATAMRLKKPAAAVFLFFLALIDIRVARAAPSPTRACFLDSPTAGLAA